MKVTSENFPTIMKALNLIEADNGMTASERVYVPTMHDPYLTRYEIGLAKLTGEQLYTFCIGEQGDQDTLIAQFGLGDASSFLNDFFNNWESEV